MVGQDKKYEDKSKEHPSLKLIQKKKQSELSKKQRKLAHKIYQRISHSDRIDVIYSRFVHNMRYQDIKLKYGLNYHSVRNIIE